MTENIGKLLKKASVRLSRDLTNFGADYDVTGSQMMVLDYLSDHVGEPISQKDIEREFDIQKSTVSTLLQRMEKKGLIARTTSPEDTRTKLVTMTDLGKPYVDIVKQYSVDKSRELLKGFTPDQQATIVQFLKQNGEKND
jgi:DNA-binding MarR family transcriptional regulator